ncbi:2-oxoglutarate synthase subunit KorC [Desulfarculales bacterium]
MSEKQVVITGFGGQGIVLTGNILGKAATIFDGRHATMTQNYGPEARGGSCSSQVIVSEEDIAFPYVEHPHVLVCMSQEGYENNASSLRPDGMLIWDSNLVRVGEMDPLWQKFQISATRIAEELGNKMMANIVILGFLSAISDLVGVDSLRQAMLASVPSKTKETNSLAFDRGREQGLTQVQGQN